MTNDEGAGRWVTREISGGAGLQWRWVCPGCGRRVRVLFMPVQTMTLPEFLQAEVNWAEWDRWPRVASTLACVRCHRVRYLSTIDRHSWNAVVGQLTGGLLYGHEVERPEDFVVRRKRAYRACAKRAPSARRLEIRAMRKRGMKVKEIAREVGITVDGVWGHLRGWRGN